MSNLPQNPSDSGYFDSSHSLSEAQSPSYKNNTPVNRKRKASCIENCKQNVSEVMDCYSPPFSSTLNESLMKNLETIHLENKQTEDLAVQPQSSSSKFQKPNDSRKFCSVPNTPEQQVKYSRDSITKKANTNSFIKNFAQFGMQSQSPLNKEAYDILYPELPSLERKKPVTPLKTNKSSNQAKKRLFYMPSQNLLKRIISNHVIMNKILRDLSNGDLYRLAKVSSGFKGAILSDINASKRFLEYMSFHIHHKENYGITPPASPEKGNGSDTESDASPRSRNFVDFYRTAKVLNKNQSLLKCPKCQKPSVVENDIAQCQNISRCGCIYCTKCDSFAYNPRDFKDKCNHAQLLNTSRLRNRLEDVSNCTATSDYMTDISNSFFSSSFNLNMSSKYDSSGIFSECEVSTPKENVKRNLSKAFGMRSEVNIFSASNARVETPKPKKLPRRTSLVPVIPLKQAKTVSDIIEPPSPPREQQHSACSKQSKRNLKRLTR